MSNSRISPSVCGFKHPSNKGKPAGALPVSLSNAIKVWYERLPTTWASLVLEINPHLLIWRNAGFALRAGDVERCQDLL